MADPRYYLSITDDVDPRKNLNVYEITDPEPGSGDALMGRVLALRIGYTDAAGEYHSTDWRPASAAKPDAWHKSALAGMVEAVSCDECHGGLEALCERCGGIGKHPKNRWVVVDVSEMATWRVFLYDDHQGIGIQAATEAEAVEHGSKNLDPEEAGDYGDEEITECGLAAFQVPFTAPPYPGHAWGFEEARKRAADDLGERQGRLAELVKNLVGEYETTDPEWPGSQMSPVDFLEEFAASYYHQLCEAIGREPFDAEAVKRDDHEHDQERDSRSDPDVEAESVALREGVEYKGDKE